MGQGAVGGDRVALEAVVFFLHNLNDKIYVINTKVKEQVCSL